MRNDVFLGQLGLFRLEGYARRVPQPDRPNGAAGRRAALRPEDERRAAAAAAG